MKKLIWYLIIFVIITSSFCTEKKDVKSYSGQEKRNIKALSSQKINGYLGGHGMGLAKAAELNNYPGPKHVLELKSKLKLSKQQVDITKNLFNTMHQNAVQTGKLIIKKESLLNKLFEKSKINAENLNQLVNDIAQLKGKLRIIHLETHLEMKTILTSHQIKKYNQVRGYKENIDTEKHNHYIN